MAALSSPERTDRSDRLHSGLPVLISVAVLFGVTLGGALLLRDLVGLGLLFLANR